MSAVFASQNLLYCFHICALVNEVTNFFRVDMIPPIVEGMDMVEEWDHLMNHRLRKEGMNMMEVDGMDTVEEHFHPMNHRSEVEDMNIVEEHFHPMNHRPEVEDMDTMDTGMR
jgi:hypothetical protein